MLLPSSVQNTVSSRVVKAGYNPEVDGASRGESGTLDKVTMFGVQSRPNSASVDGVGAVQVSYSQDRMVRDLQMILKFKIMKQELICN